MLRGRKIDAMQLKAIGARAACAAMRSGRGPDLEGLRLAATQDLRLELISSNNNQSV
jgi:hypothetical protein